MISLIEADEDVPGNLAQVEKDLLESVRDRHLEDNTPPEQRKAVSKRVVEINDEELPERMRGKGILEIVDMYKNLESSNGRMANDLGTQRKLTDRLLDLKRESDLHTQSTAATPQVTGTELLDNPNEAIERIIASHLSRQAKESDERMQLLEGQLAAQQFLSKHPDYQQIAADADFAQWVRATQYRARSADAAANGNWAAADELVSEYKDRRQAAAPRPKADNKEAARAAELESPAGESARSARKGGKVFRRVDLLELQINKPDVYYDEGFQAEILLAYSEGRVK